MIMKKLSLIVAALMLCFMLPIESHAEEMDAGTYQKVMGTSLAKFFIKAQPSDAIPLETELTVGSSDLGTSEDGVYFNLPRLKNQYYYVVDNEKWTLDKSSPYPSLSLKNGVISTTDEKIVVSVYSGLTDSVLARCTLTIKDQLQGQVRTPWSTYSNIKAGLEDNNQKVLTASGGYLNAYNPKLHKSAIVTEASVFVFDTSFNGAVNQSISYNASTGTISGDGVGFDEISWTLSDPYKTQEYKSYNSALGSSIRVKPYLMSSEGGVFITDSDTYDASKGVLNAGGSAQSPYMLVSNDKCIFVEYNSDKSGEDENIQKDLNIGFSYTYNDITQGYLTTLYSAEWVQFYPATMKYTVKQNPGSNYTLSAYGIGPTQLTFNISGNFNNGSDAAVTPPAGDSTTYTLRFDYTSGLSSAFVTVTPGIDPQLQTPVRSGYDFEGWYVDEALTTLYDYKTFNYVAGGQYTLHAKWSQIGNYQVRFYDDKNNTDTIKVFKVGQLPELPNNPKFTGYQFKSWVIVNTISDQAGTQYNPSNFKPQNGDSYIFKAMWDVQGVILSVTPNQTEYWIGDEVDKSKLVVLVQIDSNGTTKTLSTSEFSVSPKTIDKTGNNVITVTYDATGATATVTLTGKADYVTGISAAYDGDDLFVGDTIPLSSIKCKVTYKSGKVVETDDFSISPSTIRSAGTNTITVSSNGYTTSITVNGKKLTAEAANESNGGHGRLSSISASYTGPQLYVGDNIQAKDIKVTARYTDGSTSEVSTSLFNYSPNFVRNAGTNTITVTYQDMKATLNITARENSSFTNDTASSNRDNGYGSSSTGTNTTSNGTEGTGGNLLDKDGKGTSVGYLNGKNILDSLGSGTSESSYSDVDILREINEAQDKATSIDITLINTAMDNLLTPEMVKALRDKELLLNVTMVSPKDKSSRVGFWSFDGASIPEFTETLDLNIAFESVNKTDETMYHISFSNFDYPATTVCQVTMKDAYVAGTFVNMYECDENLRNSTFINNMLWSNSSELSLPIADSNNFVITDGVVTYDDGSDLTKQIIEDVPLSTDTLDDSVDSESENVDDWGDDFDWGDEDTNDNSTKDSFNIKPFVYGGLALVFITGTICFALFVIKNKDKLVNQIYDDDDIDNIPDYDGDDINDESDYDDEYFIDEEDE